MNSLFASVEPYARHQIAASSGHGIYVEECGNRHGVPVVFLHGGPGGGCNENHRRYFDPAGYRIVLIDQRGSGRSTPYGETRGNDTQHLVEDLELIRNRLDIEHWLVMAGSWGVALALYYAQSYPGACLGMILRGSFLAREQDLNWFVNECGVARIFPEISAELWGLLSSQERVDPIAAYYRHIHGSDTETSRIWARTWSAWGDRVATWNLPACENAQEVPENIDKLMGKARIETHYAHHRYFLRDWPLLENTSKLPDVPITIVHGRRDLTCPVEAAWTLHHAIPGSRLRVLPDAGHLSSEPPMVDALVDETNRMLVRLAGKTAAS